VPCKPTLKAPLVALFFWHARFAPPLLPRTTQAQVSRLPDTARVRAAFDFFPPNFPGSRQQARPHGNPGPPFSGSGKRASGGHKSFRAETGLPAHLDKTGDVIVELAVLNEKNCRYCGAPRHRFLSSRQT